MFAHKHALAELASPVQALMTLPSPPELRAPKRQHELSSAGFFAGFADGVGRQSKLQTSTPGNEACTLPGLVFAVPDSTCKRKSCGLPCPDQVEQFEAPT